MTASGLVKGKEGFRSRKNEPDSTEHKLIEDAYDLAIQVRNGVVRNLTLSKSR